MSKHLIIVTGPPASGKTTLAIRLSKTFHIPVFHRDHYKELLFEIEGFNQAELSKQLGIASAEILFHIMEQLMRNDISFIVESYFHYNSSNDRLLELKKKYQYNTITFRLNADIDDLYNRFYNRDQTEERHLCHKSIISTVASKEDFTKTIEKTKSHTIDIGGTIIDVDTTNYDNINYTAINEAVEHFLAQ